MSTLIQWENVYSLIDHRVCLPTGKTTLLDVLAGRKTVGEIKGDILFGGIKPTTMFLRRYTGYVEQFDTLVPILTVEEMLLYTAELKLEMHVSKDQKKDAVERVIRDLGLETCRKVLIGSNMAKGISGGQAKRVNIGIALVSNPRVLFLDGVFYYNSEVLHIMANDCIWQTLNTCSDAMLVCRANDWIGFLHKQ